MGITSSLSLLSSIEAAIRLDYLRRVYGRWRDPLSKAMKLLHEEKENRARLESDLIRLWREEAKLRKALITGLVGAFRYRHWLAHGRYWTPKLGRKYDYHSVFEIGQEFSYAMEEYGRTAKIR